MVSAALFVTMALATSASPLSNQGLAELTDNGEVLLLPRHQRQPFDGWIFTRSSESCVAIEAGMLDVDSWVKRFDNLKSSKATARSADSVGYKLELTVVLGPTIFGRITRVSPGVLRFNDIETKAYSVYDLEAAEDGTCLVRYRIVEEQGKSSGWVSIMKGLEATAGDAGNFAAGISSARGFAKPEKARSVRGSAAEATRVSLAGQGTLVEIDRSGKWPSYSLRRRVALPFAEVSWAVRNKKGYPDRTSVVKSAADHGSTAQYTFGGFGGRVSFSTTVNEHAEPGGVLVVEETVAGGDIGPGTGGWRWRLGPVDGGVDVELQFSADIVAGSRVMRTMAATDPIARESFMLYAALAMMADIVGGPVLPVSAPNIARE